MPARRGVIRSDDAISEFFGYKYPIPTISEFQTYQGEHVFKLFKHLAFIVLLALSMHAFALPPSAEADRQLLAAQSAIKAEQWEEAVTAFEKVEAIGMKAKPANFDYLYGYSLYKAGEFAKASERLEKYVAASGAKGKYYREALESLNGIEIEKKRLAQALEAQKVRANEEQKMKQAWTRVETRWWQMPESGGSDSEVCASLKKRILRQSASARNISCNCEVRQVNHPAWREYREDACLATWEGNKILDRTNSYYADQGETNQYRYSSKEK